MIGDSAQAWWETRSESRDGGPAPGTLVTVQGQPGVVQWYDGRVVGRNVPIRLTGTRVVVVTSQWKIRHVTASPARTTKTA